MSIIGNIRKDDPSIFLPPFAHPSFKPRASHAGRLGFRKTYSRKYLLSNDLPYANDLSCRKVSPFLT